LRAPVQAHITFPPALQSLRAELLGKLLCWTSDKSL